MRADRHRARGRVIVACGALLLAAGAIARNANAGADDWPVYGGSPAGDRFSALEQIDTNNVSGLREVWRYETGAGRLQASPLMIGGILYGVTPGQGVFALDAATGKRLWEHRPSEAGEQPVRGLTYWSDGDEARLFSGNGADLIALDPKTGASVRSFGDGGRVDLRASLGRDPERTAAFLTTPGIVYRDLIITGFRTSESAPAAPGAVRAYDVRTGALRWTFNLIPKPGEPGHETWPADAWRSAGGANAWAGMALDAARGIVFVPTGSAVDDFYGGDRPGDNLYANSLVALDAATGRHLWHFQAVHHDILDRDFPSPPVLLTVRHQGRAIDAVAQPSKQGLLFLFDRVTGKPLFPIEERPVPASDVPGERAAPTQPFPLRPAPFARQSLTAEMLTGRTPAAEAAARKAFAAMRSGGPFQPLGVGRQTIVFPGFDGGAEWGGSAVDRRRGILYLNSNDIAWSGGLALPERAATRGEQLYQAQCAACHGVGREGAPPDFPRLDNVAARMNAATIAAIIKAGRGRMPGFPQIPAHDRAAIADFLIARPAAVDREVTAPGSDGAPSRYVFTGYRKFLDPDGYPAVAPPWGTLNAIDLNTGEYLWKVPLGEYPELAARGMANTGSENYGGPIVTAGGLLFIGATIYDRKFRAFDARTGRLLWETILPYAGVATPITYSVNGRQFVVLATSAGRDPKAPQGSAYIAFALP
ncbi:PQQ-binding-like beta-propeller repeat protein [Sphingosinicella sp. BN140058]|uniref:outer membrane protein assembly factor BamB family protein n=1 Tax=Sphingosinicella sp. BN140058 TaxID=1892855 RepID=UPI001011FDDC|nr:PQQ-binding-like beta-propeller repeat protein [Sphingosinicella sp. BN140058]QAY76458.1 c-type cytochrome [Sphingosinicella sp. BN140058]